MKSVLPAEAARVAAGLTLLAAAKRLGVHPRYLRGVERKGCANDVLMSRAARLYGCSGRVLFHTPAYLRQEAEIQKADAKTDAKTGSGRMEAPSRRKRTTPSLRVCGP